MDRPRVALFVTCLVDLYRPSVGFAAIRLLEQNGCRVEVPLLQTCCGQPAYNSGDRTTAQDLAREVIGAFAGFDHVVVPSGSCAAMLVHHYPGLFAGSDPEWHARALELAARTRELTAFLHDVLREPRVAARHEAVAVYHDACSGLRELGIRTQPRALLSRVEGLVLRQLADPEQCCGFGGTFCVKYPAISTRMVAEKVRDIRDSGADTVIAGDLGCLLNIAGRLWREGGGVRAYHVAEVLAGTAAHTPAIGEGEADRTPPRP
ncbi:MAG: (Fe-S)-binding protein [Rhodovarius sp.]|nr:(Fe-S)-binding protein [Rhodovarius sp.]MCX7933087.1 (Fe-S)-binding protein [Rhodovarius sp.]MDW8314144.1 (Fe-S)-binding protein [Rhodovarius sp.]